MPEDKMTYFELLQVFPVLADNEESITAQFLPNKTHIKIDREAAIAASTFIKGILLLFDKDQKARGELHPQIRAFLELQIRLGVE